MQVHVKTPRIRVDITGEHIPAELMDAVRAVFKSEEIEFIDNEDDELINWFETAEHREIAALTTPGDVMRIYRENRQWSQAKLGEELGGLSRQKISDMERGRLTISADTAIALSRVFGIPVERFRRRGNLG
ncbi:MAG: XRE family transcriptional regulator [Spirochaetaceae bacterium]|nr:MAG: XRE family transcriptional regulator [Spirochaetaceae bacterium]